jgi:hypothetical protein
MRLIDRTAMRTCPPQPRIGSGPAYKGFAGHAAAGKLACFQPADQRRQFLDLIRCQAGQRRAHRAGIVADHLRPELVEHVYVFDPTAA